MILCENCRTRIGTDFDNKKKVFCPKCGKVYVRRETHHICEVCKRNHFVSQEYVSQEEYKKNQIEKFYGICSECRGSK